jgi:hypothetical protein
LIERFGGGNPFAALAWLTGLEWLAGHGGDADAELSQAKDLVRSYQDTPQRTVMLVALAQLPRKQ